MEPSTPATETWEVETNGQIFEASFDELTSWIADGSVLRVDRVRKSHLRWIEAGKVPALLKFFNQIENSAPVKPSVTSTRTEVLGGRIEAAGFDNHIPEQSGEASWCVVHADLAAVYSCETCANLFCKACPSGYGASVKICPFCGAMCRSLAQQAVVATHEDKIRTAIGEGFGFGDFIKSLAFPFNFKVSLLFGSILFVFFSLGQGAGGFGGIFMVAGSIICFMAANMLTFGVLSNTIDNFAQGKTEENFMPSFEDFSIWDDVVHPFFLSIGVYLASFGPLAVVALVAIFFVVGSIGGKMNGVQSDAARAVDPSLPYAAKTADQSEEVRRLVGRAGQVQQQRVQAAENGQIPTAPPEDEDADRIQQMIRQQKTAQLEATLGKTPETKAQEQAALIKKLLGIGVVLLLVGGVALLWGLFYFPAACAVAGYTRSFAATMNPSVGLDTIRRLGSSYVLILLMGFILSVASGFLTGIFGAVLSPFDMPSVGNIPAKILSGFTGFYFWVVWSCLLGYVLFKNSDKLKLAR